MRRILGALLIGLLMGVLSSNATRAAEVETEVQKAAVVTTMTEAILAVASLVNDRSSMQFDMISWSATYSERDWVLTAQGKLYNGEAVGFAMSGYRWGADKDDWLITYAGLGEQGKDPILINGKATWHFDASLSDHVGLDFQQSVKFGEHTMWGWVLGSEIIFGGTLGAGGAIATVGLATGGIGLAASFWVGGAGAVAGSGALVSASDAAKNLIEADRPPPPPPAPKRPSVPKNGEKLFPQRGKIYTAVSRDGAIAGSGPDGILLISGKFDGSRASGTVSRPK